MRMFGTMKDKFAKIKANLTSFDSQPLSKARNPGRS
jgi:hypothetical protein